MLNEELKIIMEIRDEQSHLEELLELEDYLQKRKSKIYERLLYLRNKDIKEKENNND